ncbi:MAG: DUF5317 family protein [Actinomycetota bacterium]
MFLVPFVILGLITVPLAGGRIGALADIRFVRLPLLAAAFAVQVPLAFPGVPDAACRTLHLASYALIAGFLVANRHLTGIPVLAAGATTNLLAIAANAGVMPATAGAYARAGLTETAGFASSAVLEAPRLLALGDVFAIPASFPLHNVFSIGDVLIAVGALLVVHAACGCGWLEDARA